MVSLQFYSGRLKNVLERNYDCHIQCRGGDDCSHLDKNSATPPFNPPLPFCKFTRAKKLEEVILICASRTWEMIQWANVLATKVRGPKFKAPGHEAARHGVSICNHSTPTRRWAKPRKSQKLAQ